MVFIPLWRGHGGGLIISKMNKRFLLLLTSLLLCFVSYSQPNHYKQAEKFYNEKKYLEAIPYYKEAYKHVFPKLKPDCLWKTAECYRLLGDMKHAKIYYKKVVVCNCEYSAPAAVYLSDTINTHSKKIQ